MNNHFTVTIHDDNGVKQINLHKFVKKAIGFGFGFILLLTFISVATILYLDFSVDAAESKKNSLNKAYTQLKKQNKKLTSAMDTKKKKLDELSDSLSEIQSRLGMNVDEKDNISIEERVDLTKLTTDQMLSIMQLIPSGSPIEYHGITSRFGYRIHPTLHKKEFHRGTDLKAKMKTPVYAPADGIIEFSGVHKKSGFGRLVIINHAYGFKTYYGHLNKVVVKSLQYVKKGDLIAYTGNAGMSNGPHLHYEIRFMYNVLNPYYFIKWTLKNYNEIFQKEKKVPWQSLITATSNLMVRKPTQTLPLLQQEQ